MAIMTDRIDPGPGWRLLEAGEIVEEGDERRVTGGWAKTHNAGLPQSAYFVYRRRITAPRATKAIATRATVRAVFPDGATIADSIACESGLSMKMMQFEVDRWALSKIHLQTSGAKYIMLEIQREGEP